MLSDSSGESDTGSFDSTRGTSGSKNLQEFCKKATGNSGNDHDGM